MRRSVAAAAQSLPLNSLAPRPAKASIGVNRADLPAEDAVADDVVSLVFETLAEIGMSDKEAAYEMALDPAQLSRMKTRQARMPIDALWRLPDRFWLSFHRKVGAARHLEPENEARVRAARISELVRLLLEGVA